MNGLGGLAMRLDRHCCCGGKIAVIVEGAQLAALHCQECRQFRQWIEPEVFRFLVELIATFGRPTEPITVFEGVNRLVT